MTSFDVAACAARAAGSEDGAQIPAHGLIRAIARAAKTVLLRASAAAPGKGAVVDLAGALTIALNAPDAARRWIRGEPLFAAAKARLAPK